MGSGRVLCAWEYGAGTGHLYNLAPVVQGLAGLGAQVVLATAEPALAASFLRDRRVAITRSPRRNPWPSARPALSHCSLLLNLGFGDVAWLSTYLHAWRRLLRAFRPQLLVCDHADGALIAARSLGIPAITVGSGFFNPPLEAPLPAFDLGLDIDAARLQALEEALLSSLNQALRRLQCAPLDQVAALYRYPTRLAATVPELDHYGARSDLSYCGPTGPTWALPRPCWPRGAGEPVFLYVTPGQSPDPELVAQLSAAGYRVLIAAPGLPAARARPLLQPGVRLVRHPVSLAAVARDCRLLFCNANHGTVATILRHGRVPLVIPTQVEQAFLTRRLLGQGLAVGMVAASDSVDCLGLIRRLETDRRLEVQAQGFCRKYRALDERCSGERLLTRVLEHLC